jgi:Glycosyltransferase family 87
VPAMQGVCLTLEVGQYGILVTGLLAGSLAFLKREEEILAGLFLGLSLVKPTISAPFFLAFLCRRHYLACAATLTYCGVASLVAWVVMGANPLEMLQQLHACGSTHANEGTYGIIHLVFFTGVERKIAVLAVMAVSLALLCAILISRGPRMSLADAFALAAIAGWSWTYHRSYDTLMLLFLVIPLADRIRMCRFPIPATVALLLVGLSFWPPSRFIESLPVQLLQNLIWLGAAAVLVVQPIPNDSELCYSSANLVTLGRHNTANQLSAH